MNRKRALLIILILFTGLFPLIPIPIAKATEATVSIQNSEDDVWMTEIGNIFGYESSVRILDPEIGIRSFLRFEDVPLLKSSKINYATLYVYAGFDQGETISPGASVTIYGIDEPDCAPFSYSGRVWSLERPYTSASVNWNVSDWHYSSWKSVNVTSIVREIINQYAWEQNNSIGFQILGATDSGYEYRTFEDIDHQHHGAYAYLHFHYDTSPEIPPGLPDTTVWEETYGEYDIWRIENLTEYPPLDPIEYTFQDATGAPYDLNYSDIEGVGPYKIEDTGALQGYYYPAQRKLVRTGNGTLYTPFADGSINVSRSIDDGVTWPWQFKISTYPGMDGFTQLYPSIALDSNNTIYVAWAGRADGFANDQIWIANYTDSWGTPIRISPSTRGHYGPSIAIDQDDNIYATWRMDDPILAGDQIWIVNYTGSWGTPIRISTHDDMDDHHSFNPTIAISPGNNVHVVWQCTIPPYSANQIWYALYDETWQTPIRISTYPGMNLDKQEQPSIAIDPSNNVYVAWQGETDVFPAFTQTWIVNYTGSWGTPIRLSIYDDVGYHYYPTIAIDENSQIHTIWQGTATGYPTYAIWYSVFTDSWSTPIPIDSTGTNIHPSLRWSRYPADLMDDTFILTDENGTVIQTWNGDNFTDIDDLKDWTDDYVDPGGGDPLDPDPGTQGWDTEGPWTRFNMRVYFLFIGLGCVFGPVWAMAYKKFDSVGYAWCFIVIVLGVGLLWSITGI